MKPGFTQSDNGQSYQLGPLSLSANHQSKMTVNNGIPRFSRFFVWLMHFWRPIEWKVIGTTKLDKNWKRWRTFWLALTFFELPSVLWGCYMSYRRTRVGNLRAPLSGGEWRTRLRENLFVCGSRGDLNPGKSSDAFVYRKGNCESARRLTHLFTSEFCRCSLFT